MPHEFLSDDWITEARRVRAGWEIPDTVPVIIRANIKVTDVPFTSEVLAAHVDTSGGIPVVELGHLDQVDLTITVQWSVAKALFIDGQPSAAMSAFLNGKISLDGDMTKLVELQNLTPHPDSQRFYDELRAITA
jgi:hypothetical protein